MNWLRLDDFDVSNPRLIRGEHDEVVEVQVDCVPNKFDVELCCLARKLVKNGSKAVRYRDLKIEAAPTWLLVTKQRYRCQSCDRTLYQKVPHVDDKHMMTTRLREAVELSAVKRTFADTVHVHGIEPTLATRVFRSYADRMLLNYRYKAPRIFGIDENMLLKGLRGVIVDVANAKLLDILPGNTQSEVRRGLQTRMEDWDNVEVWCQDMAGGYKGVAEDLFASVDRDGDRTAVAHAPQHKIAGACAAQKTRARNHRDVAWSDSHEAARRRSDGVARCVKRQHRGCGLGAACCVFPERKGFGRGHRRLLLGRFRCGHGVALRDQLLCPLAGDCGLQRCFGEVTELSFGDCNHVGSFTGSSTARGIVRHGGGSGSAGRTWISDEPGHAVSAGISGNSIASRSLCVIVRIVDPFGKGSGFSFVRGAVMLRLAHRCLLSRAVLVRVALDDFGAIVGNLAPVTGVGAREQQRKPKPDRHQRWQKPPPMGSEVAADGGKPDAGGEGGDRGNHGVTWLTVSARSTLPAGVFGRNVPMTPIRPVTAPPMPSASADFPLTASHAPASTRMTIATRHARNAIRV